MGDVAIGYVLGVLVSVLFSSGFSVSVVRVFYQGIRFFWGGFLFFRFLVLGKGIGCFGMVG